MHFLYITKWLIGMVIWPNRAQSTQRVKRKTRQTKSDRPAPRHREASLGEHCKSCSPGFQIKYFVSARISCQPRTNGFPLFLFTAHFVVSL